MQLQALGEAERDAEKVVEPRREKFEQLVITDPDRVDRIGPIDQHPAPNHQSKERKIDPMQPTDGERMFLFELFGHLCVLNRIIMYLRRNTSGVL